jgi:hypothetical protein
MNYKDAFGAEPTGKPELHLGRNEGITEGGDIIFPAQLRVDGKAVQAGKVLYFRNNPIADLDFDKAGTDGYAKVTNAGLSRDGKWIFVRGKNTINTDGVGVK